MSQKKTLSFMSLVSSIMIAATIIFTGCAMNPLSPSSPSHIATATPIGGLAPYGGKLVINDLLTDNSLGQHWDEYTISTGSCHFSNGSYIDSINASASVGPCIALNTDFSNLAFEVKMAILAGNYGGIYIRRDNTAHTDYEFAVDSNGFYILSVRTGRNQIQTLKSGPATSFHKGYNQSNVLAVVARGSNIDLYVNQQPLVTVQNTSPTHGSVGVLAQEQNMSTQVSFNDASVWQF